MFLSNVGGDPVTQLNLKKVLKCNEVASSSECDYN